MDTIQVLVGGGQALIIAAAVHSGMALIASAIDRVALIQNAAFKRAQSSVDELHALGDNRPRTTVLTPEEIQELRGMQNVHRRTPQ